MTAGVHTVTVTDSLGCSSTCEVTITEPEELTCSVTQDSPVECNGEANGTATVTPAGGNGDYTYLWDNQETTATATGLTAGVHTVIVTDSLGCSTTCEVTITEPEVLTCSASQDSPVECNGEANGTATVTPAGGNGDYTYLWDNQETTATATGLTAGVHTVTVTDSLGCTTTCEVTITEPEVLTCSASQDAEVVCNGGSDGVATVIPSGGNGDYTYLWDNQETTATATGLDAGVHTVTVTDSLGCTTTCQVTITEPPFLTSSSNVTICFGESSFIGDVSYSYPGSYTDTLTSVDGCDSVVTLNLTVNPIHEVLQAAESCDPQDVGTVTVVSGTGEGCDSSVTTTTTLLDSYNITIYETSCDINDVGSSSINLVGSNGCDSIVTTIVSLVDEYNLTVNATTCDPNGVGETTQTFTASTGCDSTVTTITTLVNSYNITILNVSCDPDDVGTNVQTLTSVNGCDSVVTTITDLANSYALVVNTTSCDPNDVGTSTEVLIASSGCDSTITTITTLVESYDILTVLTTCNPLDTGYVRSYYASVQGCDSIVTVQTILLPSDEVSLTANICAGDTYEFNGMTISTTGTYASTLQNTYGCDSLVVLNLTVDPYETGAITVKLCEGDSATIDGETYYSETGVYIDTIPSFNCDSIVTLTIEAPEALSISATQVNVSCNGTSDGSIDLTVTGGFPPYTFNWSNGEITEDLSDLAAGTYTVIVTDANECENEAEIEITEPDELRVSGIPTASSCFSTADGSIDITVEGGTLPYSFSWSNGEETEDISNLLVGTYTVTVTDSNNCIATFTTAVTTDGELEPLIVIITADADNLCVGGGSATITGPGGLPVYQWFNNNDSIVGATDSFLVVTEPGSYTLYVEDATGCNSGTSDPLIIGTSPPLTLDINQGGLILCPDGGTITLAADEGFETYEWYFGNDLIEGESSNIIAIDQEGTYYVVVTDENGCTGTDSIDAAFETYETSIDTVYVDVIEATGTVICLEDEWEFPGDIVSVSICRQPSEVTFDFDIDGSTLCIEFDRRNEEVGTDTLCIIVCDNSVCGYCDTAIIIINLPDTDEPPVAEEECVEVFENSNIEIEVLINDVDPDGDELYVSNIVSDPAHGYVTIEGDGSTITYTPFTDYCGTDTFFYEVCDVNNNGCDTTFVCIDVLCECFIPDGFSPNNDGINDFFVIECLDQIDNGILRVYNRWGTEIYNNPNYKNDWDGTYKGQPLPEGTYYFTITFTDHYGNTFDGAGDLTILR
ncbi:MAG: gliding motility-associated C-terminal domain-containing protein [Chitinophagales bacterium]